MQKQISVVSKSAIDCKISHADARRCQQAACHASCVTMLAMRSRSRSRCSAVLLCYRTQLQFRCRVDDLSMIDSLSDLTSAAAVSSSALRPASEQMAYRSRTGFNMFISLVDTFMPVAPVVQQSRHAGDTLPVSAARRSVLPTSGVRSLRAIARWGLLAFPLSRGDCAHVARWSFGV